MIVTQERLMRVVFMGSDQFACPTLEFVARAHQVQLVVTQPDKPAGRFRRSVATPVKLLAEHLGMSVSQPETLRDPFFLANLKSLSADVIVVVAYGKLLPKEVLDLPRFGCVNVHPSMLPKFRGAAPIVYSIYYGDEETGVTTIRMDEKLDSGPILLQKVEPVHPEDTAGTLEARLAQVGAHLLLETLTGLEKGTIQPQPQDHWQASDAPKISKDHGLIEWDESAERIERHIRAYDPWPGSYTFMDGTRIRIWRAKYVGGRWKHGEIMRSGPSGIEVGTGKGVLIISELQREGGRRMRTADFLRGWPLKAGQKFSTHH